MPESFKKKDVVEILSHKKAYNACEYQKDTTECHTHLKVEAQGCETTPMTRIYEF